MHLGGDPKKSQDILYTCGTGVVIRNLKEPIKADLYSEHAHPVNVARLAPTGFYVASADSSGKVRVWDTTQAHHPLKIELQSLGGPIFDLQWSQDAQRIVVVGEGREKFGNAFFWDSGASVGEISGHSKAINSCDIKQTRPFRVATGSEDFKVNFFEGPPFKYTTSMKDHTRFVNCVRFSPNGELLVSVGSDKLGIVYDGKTGEKKGELKGHDGSIFSCAWSPDSTKILTASADKKCKIWDAASFACLTTFTYGEDVLDQQVGCLWQGDTIVSLSLSGDINYLDANSPAKPARVIKGHNKVTTAVTFDAAQNKLLTADYEGNVVEWDVNNGETKGFTGAKHTNSVVQMQVQGRHLVTVALDDSIKITSLDDKKWGGSVGVGGAPSGVAVSKKSNGLAVIATNNSVVVVRDGKIASKEAIKFQATCVALSIDDSEVAVGGADNKIHIYTLSGDKLTAKTEYSNHRGAITRLQYSPNGKFLASCDTNREVLVFENGQPKVSGWVFHTARVNSLAWSPDSVHLATAGLDTNIIVWNIVETGSRILLKGAHSGGVKDLLWTDDNTVASVGQDCALKTWSLTF